MTYEEIKKNMPEEYEYVLLLKDLTENSQSLTRFISKSPEFRGMHTELPIGLFKILVLQCRSRKKDKLRYRYPRGESYLDVIQRLEIFFLFQKFLNGIFFLCFTFI